jgi:hypothetical protein
MQTSNDINELAGALAKAQGEITGALKDSSNPFFKSKYSDLASCWDACRQALSKNGLAVMQAPWTDPTSGHGFLRTTLMHASGQWMHADLALNPKDDTSQAVGSAITYARRYALCAFVGVAQVDDDGNAASGRSEGHSPKGDMGKNVHPDLSLKASVKMRELLEQDVEEDVKCLHIADYSDVLNKDQDLYIAAADLLKPGERSAWKAYCAQAKKKAQAEPTGRRF